MRNKLAVALMSALSLLAVAPTAVQASGPPLVQAGPSAAHAAPGSHQPTTEQPTLPQPTGPNLIGTVSLHLIDKARTDPWLPSHPTREIMAQIWYPSAPWLSPGAVPHFEQSMGVPDFEQSMGVPAGVEVRQGRGRRAGGRRRADRGRPCHDRVSHHRRRVRRSRRSPQSHRPRPRLSALHPLFGRTGGRINYEANTWVDYMSTGNNNITFNDCNGTPLSYGKWTIVDWWSRPHCVKYIDIR